MTKKFVDLSTLDGKNGLTIINSNDKDDNLGYSISNAGDINGDGINDIIIGAPLSDPDDQSNAGNNYIVFGTNNGFANIIDISTLDGIN
ncbi:integrin alpha, partial [Cylindrospermopsis raciborskii]|uniref:integrin alpha n=1 Tax=Cylindrospermopsis raciborskii TaxID=77022 RepID=UPI0038CF71B3